MKINKTVLLLTGLALIFLGITTSQAAVTENEAARLGQDLTPMGAIKGRQRRRYYPSLGWWDYHTAGRFQSW